MATPLTPEQEQIIAEDYVDGAAPSDLQRQWGLTKPRFYRLLRRRGVEPDNRYQWFHIDKHPRCVVCGDLIAGWGNHTLRGVAYYRLTCYEPTCIMDAMTNPHLIPAERRERYERAQRIAKDSAHKSSTAAYQRRRSRHLIRATAVATLPRWLLSPRLVELIETYAPNVDIPWMQTYSLTEDRRGNRRERAHESPWSLFSRLHIFARLVASGHEETAISVRASSGQMPVDAFREKYLGSTEEARRLLEFFDVFLAWNCSCPSGTRYSLHSIDDFPKVPGTYGLCEQCGSAAIHIGE